MSGDLTAKEQLVLELDLHLSLYQQITLNLKIPVPTHASLMTFLVVAGTQALQSMWLVSLMSILITQNGYCMHGCSNFVPCTCAWHCRGVTCLVFFVVFLDQTFFNLATVTSNLKNTLLQPQSQTTPPIGALALLSLCCEASSTLSYRIHSIKLANVL